MGILIDIVHDERVRDPAHAARLYRALGVTRVQVDGWEPTTTAQIDGVLDAALHLERTTMTFRDGTLDDAALEALGRLAPHVTGYVDVGTPSVSLRVWPMRSWMHGYRRLDDRDVSEVLGQPVELTAGRTQVGDVLFKISRDAFVPFDIESSRADLAFQLFRRIADRHPVGGFATHLGGPAREQLRRFFHALVASYRATIVTDVDVAAALAAWVPGELDWEIHGEGNARVRFPEGEISTFQLVPVDELEVTRWRDWISRGLAAAG